MRFNLLLVILFYLLFNTSCTQNTHLDNNHQKSLSKFKSICDRSEGIRGYLEHSINKPCKEINENDLLEIEAIYLDGRNYKYANGIKKSDFQGLTNLTVLFLNYDQETILPDDLFLGIPQLLSLNIGHGLIDAPDINSDENKFKIKSDLSFLRAVPKLKDVSLKGFATKEINQTSFNKNSELRLLHIMESNFESIKKSAFYSNTKLEVISIEYSLLSDISKLDLTKNRLLDTLNLTRNKISLLPDREPDREITETHETQNNSHLKILNLNHNQISKIPTQFLRHFPMLESLKLSNNKILTIDNGFSNAIPELKNLHLQSNQISNLDDPFSKLEKLTDLKLHNNQIEFLNSQLLKKTKQLSTLDLSQNKIESITHNAFQNLTELHTVNLSRNQIQSFDDSLFINTKKLSNLRINRNNFVSLPQLFNSLSINSNLATLTVDFPYIPKNSTKESETATSIEHFISMNKALENISFDIENENHINDTLIVEIENIAKTQSELRKEGAPNLTLRFF